MKYHQKQNILIVDDDPLNIEIIEEILGDQYEYRSAASGDEALEEIADFLPDLVLLDIMMPGMDGYEVCRRIRNNEQLSLTKIILVSAKQMLRDRLDGYRAGADDYISKPFDPEELMAKIKVFLRLKSVEEVERIKSNLLSVFSHETRTPLHTIIGFSTLLLENKSLSENESEALTHIMKSGQDMLDLIEKTILLSHLRDGENILKDDKIQVERLIGMAAERISYEFNYHGIEIKSKVSPDTVIEADEELIVTALSCLFDNAIKYSDENSIIKVSAETTDNKKYKLIIRAEGKSISQSKLKTMFSEFQVDDVAHHGRGHGLGLSLLKHIIEMHGGEVSVSTDSHTRSTSFSISFPIERLVATDSSSDK